MVHMRHLADRCRASTHTCVEPGKGRRQPIPKTRFVFGRILRCLLATPLWIEGEAGVQRIPELTNGGCVRQWIALYLRDQSFNFRPLCRKGFGVERRYLRPADCDIVESLMAGPGTGC